MTTACKLHAYTAEGLVRNMFLDELPMDYAHAILNDVYTPEREEELDKLFINEGEEYDDECEGTD